MWCLQRALSRRRFVLCGNQAEVCPYSPSTFQRYICTQRVLLTAHTLSAIAGAALWQSRAASNWTRKLAWLQGYVDSSVAHHTQAALAHKKQGSVQRSQLVTSRVVVNHQVVLHAYGGFVAGMTFVKSQVLKVTMKYISPLRPGRRYGRDQCLHLGPMTNGTVSPTWAMQQGWDKLVRTEKSIENPVHIHLAHVVVEVLAACEMLPGGSGGSC